jgi:RND family efflux transporter MFP subunit
MTTGAAEMTRDSVGKKKHRWWPWAVAAIVLAGVALAAPLALRARGLAPAATQTQSGEVATAVLGDLSAKATASGNVEAQREARLSLELAGTVDEVRVSIGDRVEAGDVLVRLNTAALERAVSNATLNFTIQEANLKDLLDGSSEAETASAQAAVESAEASLTDVKDGADPNDILAARASLASAQAAYDDLLDGPDSESVRQAQASFSNAEAGLRQAQASYDRVAGDPNIGMRREALDLQQATNNYESAKAAYDKATKGATQEQTQQAKAGVEQARATLQKLLNSPTAVDLSAAESRLAQAQASLDAATDGVSAEKTEVARAQVEQARLNLAEAQEKLDKATLRAPFAGVVTAVHVAAGEQASGLAVEMADANNLEVALDVDEVDIGQIAVGQPAVIRLETWPDAEIAGTVASIAPKASAGNSAIVSYVVKVALGETALPVRIGMTADADLITAAREGVVLVPSQAITADREAGTYTVNLVSEDSDGKRTFAKTDVTIGLKDGDNTEIASGLKEGDRVLIGEIVSAAPERANSFMPPRPGGAGGGASPFGR